MSTEQAAIGAIAATPEPRKHILELTLAPVGSDNGQASGSQGRQHLLRQVPRRRRCRAVGAPAQRHRVHRAVGLWQVRRCCVHSTACTRSPRAPASRAPCCSTARELRLVGRPVGVRKTIGMVFQRPKPVPHDVDPLQRGRRAQAAGHARQEEARRDRRAVVARPERTCGRGQGPPRQAGRRSLGWSAAASVHRSRDRGLAGRSC